MLPLVVSNCRVVLQFVVCDVVEIGIMWFLLACGRLNMDVACFVVTTSIV